jgi:hypothetical protein
VVDCGGDGDCGFTTCGRSLYHHRSALREKRPFRPCRQYRFPSTRCCPSRITHYGCCGDST